jgi:eukaryotic-like serine/threonine-protein kinase
LARKPHDWRIINNRLMSVPISREKAVFDAALEVTDPAQRELFLDQACARDAELRAAVEELLATQGDAEQFFAEGASSLTPLASELESAVALTEERSEATFEEKPGTIIGRYKLLQKIGEGGCGVVYLAEQNEPIQRRVALKVIKLGMDTKNVIARFEAERQALALMDHPNIARVLDAGATDAGRPFFVMELVSGAKITEYCDRNQLGLEQRLELFIQICHAIQHAHQKGIIHRDIKPSNILVTLHDGVPVPKVIDFGIAKATEERLADKTLFTAHAQLIGTPAYMSPEQMGLNNLDLDTRSDIYSLGVLLYELLTGITPFDTKELLKSGVDEMRRTLREREPTTPSSKLRTLAGEELAKTAMRRHVEPPQLLSQLRGDLDWIIMKALEKDRNRRYETANALAMDVRRYLDHEPVGARPPNRIYRLQKLVRRNRIVFASGAAVVVALIVGLGTSTWLLVRESRLRLAAENRERISQAAFLIKQGQLQEADRLVSKVTELKPSLEAGVVLRALGEWYVSSNKLDLAALRFSQLLQADKNDESGWISADLVMAGPLLVERGDTLSYTNHRRAAIERLARDFNPLDALDADRTLKTSLLLPVDAEIMKSLEPFARLVTTSFDQEVKRRGGPSLVAIWRCVSLALMSYRQGDMAAAKDWCQKSLDSSYNKVLPRIAASHIIKAMACHQLGEMDEARSELAQGEKMIDAYFVGGLRLGNGKEGFWYDWLIARILLREANLLIGKEPAVGK